MALVVYLGVLACALAQSTPQVTVPDSVFFPQQAPGSTQPQVFLFPPCGNFALEEASIDDMQDAMANGTLSAQQLLTCYTQRVYQTQGYVKQVPPLQHS